MEVATFRHPTKSDLHVPAGGVDAGETMGEAATREVAEEVGIPIGAMPRRLTSTLWRYAGIETWCIQHFMAVEAPADLPATWRHVLENEQDHTGREVDCQWLDVRQMNRLASGEGNAGPLLTLPMPRVPAEVTIRDATEADISFMLTLRNHTIRTSTAIYSDNPTPPEDATAWLQRDLPTLIAEIDRRPVGFGLLSPFDTKTGYAGTVENSLYVDASHHRRGIGSALLNALCDRARESDLHTVVARIDTRQHASLGLHLRHHFVPVGILREAGFKFGDWLDVAYLQKVL